MTASNRLRTRRATTVEDLVNKAPEREVARRRLVQVERDGQARRGDMTDDQISSVVEPQFRNSAVVREGLSQL